MTINWKTTVLAVLGLAAVSFALTDSRPASGKHPQKTAIEAVGDAIDLAGCVRGDLHYSCSWETRYAYPSGELIVFDGSY